MPKSQKSQSPPADSLGLQCLKCGHRRLRVIYTRAGTHGKIMRRRQCRRCTTRVTTCEQIVGG
jgi:transcriptional regulator NrdR family protein